MEIKKLITEIKKLIMEIKKLIMEIKKLWKLKTTVYGLCDTPKSCL